MELMFGIGALWGTRNDVSGGIPGSDQFAILQENTVDVTFEKKELWGQLQFPIDVARGKGNITGKAKSAQVFAALYGDIFFGVTPTTGSTTVSENEAATVPATTPFTVTVANAATFVKDLGVFYTTGGAKRFTRVTTASTAGQYSVNETSGVYTFAAADANAAVAISYEYTAAGGFTIAISNLFMGTTPTFEATFYQSRSTLGSAGQLTLRLYRCMSEKLTIPSMLDGYAIQEFDFSAMANAAGQIGILSTTE